MLVEDVYELRHLYPRRFVVCGRSCRKGIDRLVVDQARGQSTGMASRVVGWVHLGTGIGHTDPVGGLEHHRVPVGNSPKEGRCMVHQTIREVVGHMTDSFAGGRSSPRGLLAEVGRPNRVAEGSPPSVVGRTTIGWERRVGKVGIEVVHEPSWAVPSPGSVGVPGVLDH